MLEGPIFDKLPDIAIPTLVIFGREDLLIPNKILHPHTNTKAIALSGQEQIPDSRLVLLSPCGHFAQWECADQVNELMLDFLGAATAHE